MTSIERARARALPRAAKLYDEIKRAAPASLTTETARAKAERLATKFLAANDNTTPAGREPLFRGGRPAMTWAAKADRYGAACLWLVARQRLPADMVVANDNEPVEGGLDTRKNGVARGKSKVKTNLGKHLDLPPLLPRLGDGERQPVEPAGHRRHEIKAQNDVRDLSDDFGSFGACADAVAPGAEFIGAETGLGTPRPGKSRGSPLRAEDPTFDEPPADINHVVELVMARANVSRIGAAFGATGRYQDRKGAAMLARAMEWAKAQVAETNFHRDVTNRAT